MKIREENFYIVSVGDRDGWGFNEMTLPVLNRIFDEAASDGKKVFHSGIVAFFQAKRHEVEEIRRLCDQLRCLRDEEKDFESLGIGVARPHSKSLSSVRFKVLRHGRTSLWLAGFGFQAAGAADEQVLSGHRRGLLHNTHICRCLEAYSSRGAFFSELQSGQIQAACSSSSRRRFFISMMRQKL